MSSIFACIDSDGLCFAVTTYEKEVTPDETMVAIAETDYSIIGKVWSGSVWQSAPVNAEIAAREWRDIELSNSDFIVPLTDYPNYSGWMSYRSALRAWPSTESFPDTKPTL